MTGMGIRNSRLKEVPIAVVDFETTGLTAGIDRIVEVSVVRVDPGGKSTLAFDSLINPARKMSATEVHGITEKDVANAPYFAEVAGQFVASLKDCVVAAYNVYFDIAFMGFELQNAGIRHLPPHFCLMYMRPLLGLGDRCRLEEACQYHGIDYKATHIASDDAMASAKLLNCYLNHAESKGVATFGDFAKLKNYKFISSFDFKPFSDKQVVSKKPIKQLPLAPALLRLRLAVPNKII